MKIKDLIYETPEMSEEKLLKIINENRFLIKRYLLKIIESYHKDISISEAILKEYDLIQDKKSKLTNSQRKTISGFVSFCLINMTKDNGGTSKQPTSED